MTDPKFELELDRFIEADIQAWVEAKQCEPEELERGSEE